MSLDAVTNTSLSTTGVDRQQKTTIAQGNRRLSRSEQRASLNFKPGQPFNPFNLFDGAIIPTEILRNTKLLASEKLVLARLMQFAGANGDAFPRVEILADEVGLGVRQTQNCLRRLRELGLLRYGSKASARKTNRFEFLWHPFYEQDRVKRSSRLNHQNRTTEDRNSEMAYTKLVQSSPPTKVQSSAPGINSSQENHLNESPPPSPSSTLRSDSAADGVHENQNDDNRSDAESEGAFQRLNKLIIGAPLSWKGKRRILEAQKNFSFTWDQLCFAFVGHSGGLNRAGGLIEFAEHWPEATRAITEWPTSGGERSPTKDPDNARMSTAEDSYDSKSFCDSPDMPIEPETHTNVWEHVKQRLITKLSAPAYENWIARTALDSFENGTLIVRVPDSATAEWIQEEYTPQIRQAVDELNVPIYHIRYVHSSPPKSFRLGVHDPPDAPSRTSW